MIKRLLSILLITMFSVGTVVASDSYAEASVLREGNVVKIQVSETGVHSITYDELKKWGIHPEQVRVLGYGGNMLNEDFTLFKWDDLPSVAFYMHKGSDGVFNSGDYILFYAQGPIGWEYIGKRWKHTRNPYSNHGYYFLSDTAGEQRLITKASAVQASSMYDVDWFTDCRLHEQDIVNLVDLKGISGGGREFYGEAMSLGNNTLSISFDTKNVRTDLAMNCFADVAVYSVEQSSAMTLTLSDKKVKTSFPPIAVSDFYTKAESDSMKLSVKANQSGTQRVQLQFTTNLAAAVGYLNYIELNVPTQLVMVGHEMPIANAAYLKQTDYLRFTMSGASDNTQIWRVTDGVDIWQMPTTKTSDGKLQWVGGNSQVEKYIAVDVAQKNWKKPQYIGSVANQNLHALRDVDYVIICPEEFREASIRLAKKHEEVDHMTWAVVTDQEVYNEFSSGTPDVSAYRWLMKMLYDRANGNKEQQPKHLLLMGSASFDNRNLLGERSGIGRLLVYESKNSTKETQAYATDDYCGFLEDKAGMSSGKFSEERAYMNIGVGRLPVRTLEQANQVVDKLCSYMDNRLLGKWKSQICFLADDGDHGLHIETADEGAERLRKENPNFVVNKIYLDAYTQEVNASGERYPLAKNQFDNLLNNGVLFMNYSGHGGYNNITSELFMTTKDIRGMSNTKQGFWFLATCSFSHFDGGIPSAGEEAILNPHGGAIGVLSACRTVYANHNQKLNTNLCDTLFGHTDAFSYNMTLGEATAIAKNMTRNDNGNRLLYILLGDPALRINFPTDYEIRTTTQLDTLHALTKHTVRGYVADVTGDTAVWFNGPMDITVWDKLQQLITNDNDELDESLKHRIPFNDYPNVLFSGTTTVTDGQFEYTFIVPKDIRYNYGNGRIAYYAYDEESRGEAVGYFENFVVGGSSSVEIIDTIGPELQIYINNPAFKDGDKTYEFPHFFADIYDENGINTVGSGIGHDLLMVIDEDPKLTFILNDYFKADNNSYQRGKISYKMPEMTEGEHTMTFRAWDLLNNSSTATLNFQVVKGLAPTLYQVFAYPNPVRSTGVLNFRIEYDQPNEVIQTEIRMYDLSGRLIHAFVQTGTEGIQWDLNAMNALPGMYVYQVKIKTLTSDFVSKAGKIIIK